VLTSRSSNIILAFVSGCVLALSFPRHGHSLLAWISLVPLLVALIRTRNVLDAFWLGLVSGIFYFGIVINWIPQVTNEYGGLSDGISASVYILLVIYLSFFPAFFAAGIFMLHSRIGIVGLFFAPALWVSSEVGRLYIFGGFPWELLGYSQTGVLPVAQLASIFGVMGLSGLIVLVNSTIAFSIFVKDARRVLGIVATVGILLATVAYGMSRLSDGGLLKAGTPLRVAAVQANIDQHDKWNPALSDDIYKAYLDLTRQSIADGAELIIWPEAATPFSFEQNPSLAAPVRELTQEHDVHILLGTTEVASQQDRVHYYNSAVMVGSRGDTEGIYRKHHLVPFGEYVPFRSALFFVSPLVETVSDFSAGPGAQVLMMGKRAVSTAICYEVIYPDLLRGSVEGGSQLLTTITNDAWYGNSAAPFQHFQQATMRSIELGRFLVRSANTGISGVIDPYGRVLEQTALFERQVLTTDVRLLEARTIYSRIGNLFEYMCVIISGCLLAICGFKTSFFRKLKS